MIQEADSLVTSEAEGTAPSSPAFRLVLASASPRRAELLRFVVSDFIIDPARCDEALGDNPPPAEAVGLAFLAGGVAILAVRLRWMSRRLGVPAAQWFRGVLAPCAAVAAAAAAAMAAPRLLLPPGFLRLILVGAAGGGAALAAAWNLALDAPERVFVVHNARRLALKLTGGVRP